MSRPARRPSPASGLTIVSGDSMADAAQKIVKLVA